jgi:hypothetical protein
VCNRFGGGGIEEADPEAGGRGRPDGEARTEGRRGKEGLLLDWVVLRIGSLSDGLCL